MLGLFLRTAVIATAAVVLAAPLHAALVLDQEQPNFDPLGGTLAVGGDSSQKLAQVVTAGLDGRLAEVRLPIGCDSGTLILEIVQLDRSGLPVGRVLGSVRVPAADLPPMDPPAFRAISIRPSIAMRTGDRFAIVLSNPTGSCGVWPGGPGDVYGGGSAYFNDAVNGFVWIDMKTFPEDPQSLAFQTWIESSGPRRSGFQPCEVSRFGNLPIPSFVPLCRCLEDDFPREQRCTLLHPSFMLIRRIPLPLTPGKPFEVSWTLVPHEKLDRIVEVRDELPAGFQSKGMLIFDGRQIAPAEAVTLQYGATAGFETRPFRIETLIRLGADEGRMRTAIEVVPD